MGKWKKLSKKGRAKGSMKIIKPRPTIPIWQVTVTKESGKQTRMFMTTEKAEPYFKAGHQVKLITTAGELRDYK